jgi:hypothetical protein
MRDQQNGRNRRTNDAAYWTCFGLRKPKELEAQNLVLDIPEPDFYISDAAKKRFLVAVVLVAGATAVVVGVVVGTNSSDGPVGNMTTSQQDPLTSPPNPSPLPTAAPSLVLSGSPSARDQSETNAPSVPMDPTNRPSDRDSLTLTPTVGTVSTIGPTVSTIVPTILPTVRTVPVPGVLLLLEYEPTPVTAWGGFTTTMGLHNGLFLSPGDKLLYSISLDCAVAALDPTTGTQTWISTTTAPIESDSSYSCTSGLVFAAEYVAFAVTESNSSYVLNSKNWFQVSLFLT